MTKYCTQCGTQVEETARFCKKCGTRLLTTQPASAPTANYQTPNYQQPPNFGFGQGQVPYQPPYQSPAAHADMKPNIAGMLCYPLSLITGILFLVLTPYNRDRFVRFHAWQSIFFFVTLVVLSIVLRVFPRPLEGLFLFALQLLALGGTGWAMYKAYHGEEFKLPLIGEWAENQASKNTT
ncbi:MAG: zinc-ribbon domain-containing protein [Blastocatellales bacterium]